MRYDLFLKRGVIITEAGCFKGGIIIKDGKINQLLSGDSEVEANEVIDLRDNVLLPGLVDGHVHFNEPGRENWEGYLTGTKAAAAGGVTTILDMPLNSSPPTTNSERLEKNAAQ